MNNSLNYRESSDGDHTLIFLHIPKAAGATFRSIIVSYFAENKICPAYYWRDILSLTPEQIQQYKLIRGHYEHSVGTLVRKPVFITMLRDPVQRALSYYSYIRSQPAHRLHKVFQTMSLLDVISDKEYEPEISNYQTRVLGRDLDLFTMRTRLVGSSSNNTNWPKSSMKTTEVSIDLAKARLEQYAFFGITERFEDSLMLLSDTFGWRPIRHYKSANVTKNRVKHESLSTQLINIIKEKNALDIELYEYAKYLFDSRLKKLKKNISDELKTSSDELDSSIIFDFLDKRAVAR